MFNIKLRLVPTYNRRTYFEKTRLYWTAGIWLSASPKRKASVAFFQATEDESESQRYLSQDNEEKRRIIKPAALVTSQT